MVKYIRPINVYIYINRPFLSVQIKIQVKILIKYKMKRNVPISGKFDK